MIRGAVGNMDVAQLVLYAFFFFFAGLVWYLRREDRREGYPLESEASGGVLDRGFLLIPPPKTFRLASGRTVQAPNFKPDARPINAEKVEPWPGAPLQPIGDPMKAGVGPGAWAERSDETYKTYDGKDLIVPLRVATNYAVPPEVGSPVGYAVVGADRIPAGTITDLWVDRGESFLRYYEVALRDEPSRTILLPVTFSVVEHKRRRVVVEAILAEHFKDVPTIRSPDKVTLAEEERISAYYGAGTLYATPERSEPLI